VISISPFLSGLFFRWLGSQILKIRRWAWWISVGVFTFFSLGFLCYFFLLLASFTSFDEIKENLFAIFLLSILPLALFLPPLIFLLLDRKNFWKVAK
jgi:hypothetical protein